MKAVDLPLRDGGEAPLSEEEGDSLFVGAGSCGLFVCLDEALHFEEDDVGR
jgi:hypothetical protein